MSLATVAFVVSALAATFIIGCGYIGMLRFYGILEGDPDDLMYYVKPAWFVVWTGFILGLALILVG